MPLFLYQHPNTQEIKEIVQSVHDLHEYYEDGVKWNRVFTVPQVGIDSKINPYDSKAFVEKTGKMKGTLGEIMDASRELSEKRGGENDPLKKKYYQDWSGKRKGRDHPDIKKKKLKENLSKRGISLE
jgi:hypothetical protein